MEEESYSQIGQDIFVLQMLKNKTNGIFLDIGCYLPIEINNTYLLEKNYNWNGISIDIENYSEEWKIRKSKFIQHNALKINYEEILNEISINNRIDYLSLDLEPPTRTFELLNILPFNKFRFSVITFEHDAYRGFYKIKEDSRKILKSYGYILYKENVGNYEDWYIDQEIK